MSDDLTYPDFLWSRLCSGKALGLRLRRRVHRQDEGEWRELSARPIELRGERRWQFVYTYPRRDHTVNLRVDEAEARLREHLSLRLRSLVLEESGERCVVQFSRKGRPQVRWEQRAEPLTPPSLAHDHQPAVPLPADRPDPFLIAIGVMTANGRIRARQRAKFRQINEFLTQLEHARAGLDGSSAEGRPLRLLDCACGAATLSFAAQHYLAAKCGIPTQLTGIDQNAALIEKARSLAERLGLAGAEFSAAEFHASAIRDYEPAAAADILLALHACDTATDEALALGIRSGARLMLVAPCCHHHLQAQLRPAAPFVPVQRHGILEQRLGDLLTDALRALALEIMGYRCAVVEFIGSEHTDRNLMLRAQLRAQADGAAQGRAAAEYRQLAKFWGVTPHLETLLGERFRERLAGLVD